MEYEKSIKLFKRLQPQAKIFYNISVAYLHTNQPHRAESSLSCALLLDPYFAIAIILLAQHYVGKGDMECGCKYLEEAIRLFRESSSINYFSLGLDVCVSLASVKDLLLRIRSPRKGTMPPQSIITIDRVFQPCVKMLENATSIDYLKNSSLVQNPPLQINCFFYVRYRYTIAPNGREHFRMRQFHINLLNISLLKKESPLPEASLAYCDVDHDLVHLQDDEDIEFAIKRLKFSNGVLDLHLIN